MNLITQPPRSNSLGIKRITEEHLSNVQRPTLITSGKNSLTINSPPRIELKHNFEDISMNSTLFYGNRSLDIFFIFPSLSGSFHYFFDTFIYIYIYKVQFLLFLLSFHSLVFLFFEMKVLEAFPWR